ncbi:alpha-2-macroglobulin family protein [Ignatzschineria sp. LJL83]
MKLFAGSYESYHAHGVMLRLWQRSILFAVLLFGLLALLPIHAQVTSINAFKLNNQETISVFFDEPQLFKADALQKQFKITSYNYDNHKDEVIDEGKWHLSKDGYRLSYYPISEGSYTISTDQFQHQKTNSRKEDYIYLGTPSDFVKIIGRGPVLPLHNSTIPVEMFGTQEIDVEYYAIHNLPQLLENYYIGSDFDTWSLSRLVKDMTPAGIFRYVTPKDTPKNEPTIHQVPLDKNIQPGAYLITANPAGEIYKKPDTRIIFISDIGLQARLYPESTVIIGNHFSNNEPVDGATLEVWKNKDRKLEKSSILCTFEDGLCRLPKRLEKSDIVVVQQEGDISILPLKEIALDLNEYAIQGAVSTEEVAYVYSNRTLYRPGEAMTINTLLRNFDGYLLPEQPLTLSVIDPQGKTFRNYQIDSSTEGFYQSIITIPQEAKTGIWKIEARTDISSDLPLGSLKLYIEEFMPERMELIVTAEEKIYQYDEQISFNISSRYLFGAPANGNEVTLHHELSLNRTPFIGHKDWFTGVLSFPSEYFVKSYQDRGFLDKNGEVIFEATRPFSQDYWPSPSAVLRFDTAVNILDGSVLGISRSAKNNLWPGKAVPVIRPLFEEGNIGYGRDANFEIFTATPEGDIAPSNLLLTLKYEDPYCTWVYSTYRGWDCHRNYGFQIREQKVIQSGDISNFSFSPYSWGSYILEVKDLDTDLVTEFKFAGSWENSSSGQLAAAKPLHLNLSTQKPSFKPGEEIELTIDAPFPGNLTLLVEGSNILFEENTHIPSGKSILKIPFDPKWNHHDLYISGLLISKNKKDETVRSLGIIPLKIDTSARKLYPQLSFPAITLPDQPVTIEVSLSDADIQTLKNAGKESLYATISITDRGILNMIPEKQGSMFDALFKQRRYSAEIIDYYSRIFKQGMGSLLNPQFGGDSDLVAEEEESLPNLTEMKTVSLSSELISFEDGKAFITFDLPDFNGEAEVAVKIFNDSQIGEINETLIIRAPIIADLVPPKFIRVEDETFISLTLVNMTGQKDLIKISVGSEQFDIDYQNVVELDKEERFHALIPISLKEFTPFAEVVLEIDSQSFKAIRNYQIGTVHKTEETAIYDRNSLKADTLWQRNSAISGQFSQGFRESITFSKTPYINVLSYTSGLFQYPYGCTEQITSKAFPWLFKENAILDQEKRLAYQLDIQRNPKKSSESFEEWEDKMMKDTISKLLDRQKPNGGFSLWSNGESRFATSVYITDFLTTAKEKYPAHIPQKDLDRALSYLKRQLNDAQSVYNRIGTEVPSSRDNILSRFSLTNVSYATWVLAKEGRIFNADILFLKQLEHRLTPLSTAYLAAAFTILGNEQDGNILFSKVLEKMESKNQEYGYYQSDVSEIALILTMFNEISARNFQVNNDIQNELLLLLDNRLNTRKYFSTQDRYSLIKLGVDQSLEPTEMSFIVNGEAQSLLTNTIIPANSIATLSSKEPLFMEYHIEGYPKHPVQVENFKLKFTKSLNNYIGQTLKVGDRITVRLTVEAPDNNLPSGLIVDRIPGGFNLVNPNIATDDIEEFYKDLGISKAQRDRIEHEEFRFDHYLVSLPISKGVKQEFVYILEAAVPGVYEMPITTIEDMYLPTYKNIMVEPGIITIEK